MRLPIQNADLSSLISLVHHRWNIPIIAELFCRSGAKHITLINHLSMSRASLSASLQGLIELGLVERNTNHGHPMRPEYLLTVEGAAIGSDCVSLMRVLRRRDETDLAFRKWTLPLVAAIGEQSMRFSELCFALGSATPRAISIGLKSLHEQRWAARKIVDDYPPTAGYELRPKGQSILACIDGLY